MGMMSGGLGPLHDGTELSRVFFGRLMAWLSNCLGQFCLFKQQLCGLTQPCVYF